MKKVIVVALVALISVCSLFAQEKKQDRRRMDPSKRMEQLITELKLDEKQAAEVREVEKSFREEMMKNRDSAKEEREKMREKMETMKKDRDKKMEEILTPEQYKKYQEMQTSRESRNQRGKRK